MYMVKFYLIIFLKMSTNYYSQMILSSLFLWSSTYSDFHQWKEFNSNFKYQGITNYNTSWLYYIYTKEM